MNYNEPLLSICIPTYNRCVYLERTLKSIVSNQAFDDDVEIVISDNASTDDTPQIGALFASKYSNVKFFRNEMNVKDANFFLVLERSSGLYCKLFNDNNILNNDGLTYLKNKIKSHIEDRKAIFFTGGYLFNCKRVDNISCSCFDDFVKYLSFSVTAISTFGAWREDWKRIRDKLRYSNLLLNQDDWSYQIMEDRGIALLYTSPYFTAQKLESNQRSGYKFFEVHVANYYKILQPYIDKGLVSKKTLSLERRTFLLGRKDVLIQKYIYKIHPEWHFDMTEATEIIWNHFKMEPFFYLYFLTMPIWGILYICKNKARNIVKKWKKDNL